MKLLMKITIFITLAILMAVTEKGIFRMAKLLDPVTEIIDSKCVYEVGRGPGNCMT
uniref:Uncharacterized protein n=2 Tax=gambiae species complex TaxID=44542 RepID=A0A6E8W9Q6_ANOCL